MSDKKFFPLRPEPAEPLPGSIATAALRYCDICDVLISGMGGPGYGSICWECGTLIRRGQIKLDRENVLAAFLEQGQDDD